MKKLLFILSFIPLLAFPQAEKRYESIIIDSIKALNGGIIDVKDTLKHAIGIKFNDGTFQGTAATGAGDSSFVVIQFDTAKKFNNNNLLFADSVFFKRPVEVDSSFKVNNGLALLKGLDASSTNFVLKVQDNVTSDLFNVRNDGDIFMNHLSDNFDAILSIKGRGTSARSMIITNSSDQDYFQTFDNGGVFFCNNSAFADRGITIGPGGATNVAKLNIVGTGTALPFFVVQNQFKIDNDGSVSIGTTAPTTNAMLTVKGLTTSSGRGLILTNSSNVAYHQTFDNGGIFYQNSSTFADIGVTIGPAGATNVAKLFIAGVGTSLPYFKVSDKFTIENDGAVIIDSTLSTTNHSLTLGAAATTFLTTSNVMTITGDGGGNTIATITGANSGQYLILIFVDGLVTITDTDDGGANTIDLSAAFTGADDTTLHLIFDGTLWREVSRSVN